MPIYFRDDCSVFLRRMAKDSVGMRFFFFFSGNLDVCGVLLVKPFSLAAGVIYAI